MKTIALSILASICFSGCASNLPELSEEDKHAAKNRQFESQRVKQSQSRKLIARLTRPRAQSNGYVISTFNATVSNPEQNRGQASLFCLIELSRKDPLKARIQPFVIDSQGKLESTWFGKTVTSHGCFDDWRYAPFDEINHKQNLSVTRIDDLVFRGDDGKIHRLKDIKYTLVKNIVISR